ncbi:MAG: 3-hydroxyacyl-CoA dehydrogenase NAD-binding domain-containing protein [Actinomycetota bacterium]|nr:3-hydroxyacyl-CoA dehydrogenase NAD-binding domain-containing protein [Actinomycetota bacterium]
MSTPGARGVPEDNRARGVPEDNRCDVGVVGAGTMGAGIAEAAARAGCTVRLHDAFPEALSKALQRFEASLRRSVEKGKLEEAEAKTVLAHLEPAPNLADLGGVVVVIEAAPEDRALKDDLFRRLDAACPAPTTLASNTSSLSITSLQSAVADPSRVVGMHFFNPAPVMRLVEVIAGARSGEPALVAAEALVRRMDKTPVRAADTPGFIVNRVARPFYGEALRMLGEGIADLDVIDDAVRALGFRMGPFELMDLIGVDVNLAVTRSVWEATFLEPRYRPHPIQARLVEAGLHGRKTGRGFYGYDAEGRRLEPTEGIGPPEISGQALPPGRDETAAVAERLSLRGGGGIAARLLAMLVNEAIFAADEGVAEPAGIDDALRLGANHPRGPFEWLEALGPGLVLSVMEGLWDWYREDRYRPAPGLRWRAGGKF